jgi:parvulin-like peptidyl-prolyl isomerase
MPNERREKPVVHTRKHVARLERERRQTRLLLYSFILILASVIGLLVWGYLDVYYYQLEKPVAKVGDVEISTREFQTRVKLQRNQLLGDYQLFAQYEQIGLDVSSQLQQIEAQLDTPQLIGQTVVDQMVNEQVVRQEAAKRGISVSAQEIEDAVRANMGFYPNGSPTPSVTPTEIVYPTLSPQTLKLVSPTPSPTTTLAQTLTPSVTPTTSGTPELLPSPTVTPTATPTQGPTATASPTYTPEPTATLYTLEGYQAEYQASLDVYTELGLTEEQYRSQFESNLLRTKLLEAVTADVGRVEPQVWARHILVADEAAAKLVIERLNNGEDFALLAIGESKDTGSGAQGGDLGWFGKGAMVAEFEAAAFALEIGEVSQPVQSSFGWHIIQLLARQDRPLTESEYQSAREQAFSAYMAEVRPGYNIEIFDEQWGQHTPNEPSLSSLATQAALTFNPK